MPFKQFLRRVWAGRLSTPKQHMHSKQWFDINKMSKAGYSGFGAGLYVGRRIFDTASKLLEHRGFYGAAAIMKGFELSLGMRENGVGGYEYAELVEGKSFNIDAMSKEEFKGYRLGIGQVRRMLNFAHKHFKDRGYKEAAVMMEGFDRGLGMTNDDSGKVIYEELPE